MDKFPRKWEKIDDFTYRLLVPNGWIVMSQTYNNFKDCRLSTVFVPDPDRVWVLEAE